MKSFGMFRDQFSSVLSIQRLPSQGIVRAKVCCRPSASVIVTDIGKLPLYVTMIIDTPRHNISWPTMAADSAAQNIVLWTMSID